MLRGNPWRQIAGAIICVALFLTIGHSVLAAEPHEDPESAKLVFSSISLLKYYSGSLDFVLGKNPEEVETRFGKMPFANIPQSLEESADDLTTISISISHLVVSIDEDLSRLRTFVNQSRLEETKELVIKTFTKLSQANDELKEIEQTVETIGEELEVFSAPARSDLRYSYNELLETIHQIKEMVVLYNDLLIVLLLVSKEIEELLKLAEYTPAELLGSAELTLVQKPKPIDITVEELLESEEYVLVKTIEPKDTTLNELLRSANINLSELFELKEIDVFQELLPKDANLEKLLKLADMSLIRKLKPTDIITEELLNTANYILVKTPEPTDINIAEILKTIDITSIEALKHTDINLDIQPTIAFVGDYIRFEGVLTSEKRPLTGREIHILLNNSRHITTKTDSLGCYQGILQVPYWYTPELDVQALYYPQDEDTGMYLASLSPAIKLEVVFYEAELEVIVEDDAYPGLEILVTGRFDYGQSPLPSKRKAEIYFDNVLVSEVMVQEEFSQGIMVDPEADVGKHIITVSSADTGRYSSVVSSVVLNVSRATPILNLNIPEIVMVPGNVRLEGKLYSEVGPLRKALIKIDLGRSQVELLSSESSTFKTKIMVGMNFGLIGSQDLIVQVFPHEPWHATFNTTSRVLAVNWVNSGGFITILLFLGVYLLGRLRRRLGIYTRSRMKSEILLTPPELAPVYTDRVTALTVIEESKEITGEPRARILQWYRLVVRLLQETTRVLLGPQQTLREFANEIGRIVGPMNKYLSEFTRLVERLLYSQYKSTEEDVENSKRLSNEIVNDTKLQVSTQSLISVNTNGEGTEVELFKGITASSEAGEFSLGDRGTIKNIWRNTSILLWVLLIMSIIYYACMLLFILPLLAVSVALCFPVLVVDDSKTAVTKAAAKEEPTDEGF